MPEEAESTQTTDHGEIRRWIEERDGRPARVRGTGDGNDPGLLRVFFPGVGAGEDELEEIDWDEFFAKFDENDLAFLYQERTKDGGLSRFSKFVARS
jgi:hypothetical protein